MTEEIRAEDYLGLMQKLAWSFHLNTKLPYEDFLSAAYIAFVDAKRFYDPNKAKFSTFFRLIAKHKMIDNCHSAYGYKDLERCKRHKDLKEGEDIPHFYESTMKVCCHRTEQSNPEEVISFKETLSSMGREAREVCEIVFESPHEFIVQGRPKLSQGRLRDGLRERGWSWPKIRNGMREVKQTLTEMT